MLYSLGYIPYHCPGGGMVDTLDSGSSAARHEGSSPFLGNQYAMYVSVGPGGEMADTPDLGSGTARCEGSSPFLGIFFLSLLSLHSLFSSPVEETPWYTGTILSFPSTTPKPGGVSFQVYMDQTWLTDSYPSTPNLPSLYTLYPSIQIQIGICHRFGVDLFTGVNYNHGHHLDQLVFTDTDVTFGFQISDDHGPIIPDFRVGVAAIFPTGKFDGLTPDFHGADASGNGTCRVGLELACRKLFSKGFSHPFGIALSQGIYFPVEPVVLLGKNVFDLPAQRETEVKTSVQLFSDLGLEYSITQQVVFCCDLALNYYGGVETKNSSSPESWLLTLSPGLEYNISNEVGWIVGAYIPVWGKSSFQNYGMTLVYSESF